MPASRLRNESPVAAGLGGGSSDAAAALRGLNVLWGLNLPDAELASVAASLGSDVPFLLMGGAALGTGRGDRLKQLPAVETTRLLLVAPGGTISRKTPTLYGALTPDDYSDGAQTHQLADSAALIAATLTSDSCRNVFTPSRAGNLSGSQRRMGKSGGGDQVPSLSLGRRAGVSLHAVRRN